MNDFTIRGEGGGAFDRMETGRHEILTLHHHSRLKTHIQLTLKTILINDFDNHVPSTFHLFAFFRCHETAIPARGHVVEFSLSKSKTKLIEMK